MGLIFNSKIILFAAGIIVVMKSELKIKQRKEDF